MSSRWVDCGAAAGGHRVGETTARGLADPRLPRARLRPPVSRASIHMIYLVSAYTVSAGLYGVGRGRAVNSLMNAR